MAVVHNDVLPFYRRRKLPVKTLAASSAARTRMSAISTATALSTPHDSPQPEDQRLSNASRHCARRMLPGHAARDATRAAIETRGLGPSKP